MRAGRTERRSRTLPSGPVLAGLSEHNLLRLPSKESFRHPFDVARDPVCHRFFFPEICFKERFAGHCPSRPSQGEQRFVGGDLKILECVIGERVFQYLIVGNAK